MNGEKRIAVGVGAVVFRGDQVLLIRRGKPPFLGHWSIPGGKPHFGEPLEEAVRREVAEETGVEVDIQELIDVFEALPGADFADHMVLVDFWAEWRSGAPVAGDDAAAAEFVAMDEALERLSWDKTREALKGALALRNAARKKL